MKKQNNTLFTGLIIIFFIIIALISFNIYNAYKNTKDVTLLSEYIVNNIENIPEIKSPVTPWGSWE